MENERPNDLNTQIIYITMVINNNTIPQIKKEVLKE